MRQRSIPVEPPHRHELVHAYEEIHLLRERAKRLAFVPHQMTLVGALSSFAFSFRIVSEIFSCGSSCPFRSCQSLLLENTACSWGYCSDGLPRKREQKQAVALPRRGDILDWLSLIALCFWRGYIMAPFSTHTSA